MSHLLQTFNATNHFLNAQSTFDSYFVAACFGNFRSDLTDQTVQSYPRTFSVGDELLYYDYSGDFDNIGITKNYYSGSWIESFTLPKGSYLISWANGGHGTNASMKTAVYDGSTKIGSIGAGRKASQGLDYTENSFNAVRYDTLTGATLHIQIIKLVGTANSNTQYHQLAQVSILRFS